MATGSKLSDLPELHAEDVGYTFYNGPGSVTWDGKPVFGGAALTLQDYIVNFVATGTPNGRRVPPFPIYGSESNVLSINSSFGGTISVDPLVRGQCEWWQKALYY